MSAFLAFRSAAVSVLRPRRVNPCFLGTSKSRQYATKHELVQAAKQRKKEKELANQDKSRQSLPPPPPKPKVIAKHPKNDDIPYKWVQVMNEDGETEPTARSLSRILSLMDHNTHVVRLVSHKPATVRILLHLEDKINQLAAKAEHKASKSQKRLEVSIIQLSWLTADGDYEHKISRIKEELEKGSTRVEIWFKNKPRARYPSKEEMDEQMNEVVQTLAEVGQEWRPREIRGGTAKIYFQSRLQRQRKVMPTREEMETRARKAMSKLGLKVVEPESN